jgi:hypothetical protein
MNITWISFTNAPGRPVYIFRLLLFLAGAALYSQQVDIKGAVEWDRLAINAELTLDLASANIKLPAGRTQGEALVEGEYLRLLRPEVLSIPVDSSSTLEDLIDRGEYSLLEAEALALRAETAAPALSRDMTKLSSRYSLSLAGLSAGLIRHSRPAAIQRVISPVPAASYTGIIIIASEELPVHGRKGSALPLPCLFPKIWDTDMNLIYERNMMESEAAQKAPMIRYTAESGIFENTPSGLSPEIAGVAGSSPLRIIARGVYGIRPTDPIIDKADAMVIISSETNRRLLREGRVVIVLADEALKKIINE